MKNRILILAAALLFTFAAVPAKAQDRIFNDLSNLPGCTSVYVGKTILRIAGASKLIGGTGNFNASKLVGKLDAVEVIACENEKDSKEANRRFAEAISSVKGLSVLMEVKENDDDGSDVTIFSKEEPDSDIIHLMVIYVTGDSPTLVALHGSFTPEDILSACKGAVNSDSDHSHGPN